MASLFGLMRRAGGPRSPVSARPGFWGGFDLKKLFLNLAAFAVLSVLLQFAEKSQLGQRTLDKGYDYLVRRNFVHAVLERGEAEPLSPDLSLVIFDPGLYQRSYTKGLWTPRDEVGLAVLNALRRGAKVVLIDFNFQGEAPVVWQDGRAIDGNQKFLEYLGQAAELARANQAVILVPAPNPKKAPPGYLELLKRFGDVFPPADFEARRDKYDGQVRRLSWCGKSGDAAKCDIRGDGPVLSAGLLSVLLIGQADKAAAVKEAQGLLDGEVDEPRLLPPALARAIKKGNQEVSSRLIFRYLPRGTIRELKNEPHRRGDLDKGFIWWPGQLTGRNQEPDFSGKIVLIGSDYADNGDIHQTTFGSLAGSYILANGLNMMLTGRMLKENKGLNWTLLVLTGLVASFSYTRFTIYGTTSFFAGVGLVSLWLSAWTFNRWGFVVDVWLPALGPAVYNAGATYVVWQFQHGTVAWLLTYFRRKKDG